MTKRIKKIYCGPNSKTFHHKIKTLNVLHLFFLSILVQKFKQYEKLLWKM